MQPPVFDPVWLGASPLRRAAFRGLFFGAGFTLVCIAGAFLLRQTVPFRMRDLLAIVVTGVASGLIAGALALVELGAVRRPPSIGRDLGVAAGTALVACAGILLGVVQFAYVQGLVEGRDLAAGVSGAQSAVQEILGRHLGRFVSIAWAFAAPFVPLVLLRLRGQSLARQLLITPLAGVALAVPGVIIADAKLGAVTAFVASGAFLLPLACALADLAERRLASRLERGAP